MMHKDGTGGTGKMMDMGQKAAMPETVQPTGKPAKERADYPRLSLSGDQIPEQMMEMENGEMCQLHMVVRKVGDNIETHMEGEPRRVELELRKMGYAGKAGRKSRDEYLKMNADEREAYDREEVGADEDEE